MNKPAFIITIDTEGDNIWENKRYTTTKNARFLSRFQELCEKYNFKPVYLTTYEMAIDDVFIDFARDVITRNHAEIGMHLHAWNSPPVFSLTENDFFYKPYLIEYPEMIMRNKIIFMTKLLEDIFQIKILSHRAGRWAFDERYAKILIELGYQIDCSITPKVDWRSSSKKLLKNINNNYRFFPDSAYFINLKDISLPGTSRLLEVPVTTAYKHKPWMNRVIWFYNTLLKKRRSPTVKWLRPTLDNLDQMCKLSIDSLDSGKNYIQFMMHSSEFMPGGSPTFKSKESIEKLYYNLDILFDTLQHQVVGMTLAQYYRQLCRDKKIKFK